MGIKCSLLGHSFGDTEVEEERVEQGSEVLTTIKEIERCERCGRQRVVSENKEVTSLQTATEPADGDDAAASDPSAGAGADGETPSGGVSPAPDIDAAEDDAELIEEAESSNGDTSSDPSAEPPTQAATGGSDTDEPTEAEMHDDDAVILDDDDDESREPGEWPEDEDGPEAETDAAEVTDTAESATTQAATTDEEPAGSDSATEEWPDEYGYEEESPTADPVDWPEEDEGAGDDWERSESLTSEIDGASVERAGGATMTVPEGTFECPECGFSTKVEESSLRAGDFCPECRRGSLEHYPEE